MSQFYPLLRKNWILHKRNPIGTCLETFIPILFAMILSIMASLKSVTEKSDYIYSDKVGFNYNLYPTDFTNWKTAFEPGNNLKDPFYYKNCGLLKREIGSTEEEARGGKVGQAPNNALTQKIGAEFNKLGLVTMFMDSDQAMTEWMNGEDNSGTFATFGSLDSVNNIKNQFCFAISFDEQSTVDKKYAYNIRFNMTGPGRVDDHYDPNMGQYNRFQVEDTKKFDKNRDAGVAIIINMVDNFIQQEALSKTMTATPDAYIKGRLIQMPIKDAKMSDLLAISGMGRQPMLLIFQALLCFYGRMCYFMLYEKHIRVIDNMKNMGLSTFDNLMAWLVFKTIQCQAISQLWGLIAKAGFFPNQNFIIVFLQFFMTSMFYIMLALTVQTFFTTLKQGTFFAIVINIIFYLISQSADALEEPSAAVQRRYAISPVAGLQMAAKVLIYNEQEYREFQFSDWFTSFGNFTYGYWFFVTFTWIVLLFFLCIWLDQVFPTSIGEKKHWCFCCGMKKKGDYKKLSTVDDKNMKDAKPLEENLESVDEAFLAQRQNNQTLIIEKLRKVYPNKKVAVECLDQELYTNQIFALQGQNGAGKTTTISIISGLLQKTNGNIKILGLDRDEDIDKIRQSIGVCPQTNPIYEEQTVREHQELYSAIKTANSGIKVSAEDANSEIETVLKDIDLLHKANYLAGKLSGGQKRKLCVSTALIGNSKILLLDEPTSGMDTYARRHLWEMLKEYRKGKQVIQSTHYMDEADFLADRIGIMKEGKLQTCGSSLFLKNRFGVGYDLTMIKKNLGIENAPTVKIVQSIIESATVIGDSGMELKMRLPIDTVGKFEELFKTIDEQMMELCIETYGISYSTLEQVFIKVTNTGGISNVPTLEEIPQAKMIKENDKEGTKLKDALEYETVKNKMMLFKMHFVALLKKKLIYFSRDKKSIACEIIVPMCCVMLGLLFTLISFIQTSFPMMLDAGVGGLNVIPYAIIVSSQTPSESTSIFSKQNLNANITTTTITGTSYTNMENSLMNTFVQKTNNNWFGVWAESFNNNAAADGKYQFDYTIYQNSTMPHAGNIGIALMNDLIFKEATGTPTGYIKHNLNPFPNSPQFSKMENTADTVFATWLIGIALSFLPAGIVVFIVKERENNVKHQQLVSGVSLLAYWSSSLVVDLFKYYIVMIFALIMVQAFQVKGFIQEDHYGAMWIVVILYGPTMVSFTYLTSFLWKDPGRAQTLTFLINFVLGFFLSILGWVLMIIKSTRWTQKDYINYIFRLVPQFSGLFGIFSIGNTNLWFTIFKLPAEPKAQSSEGVIPEIIYLCIHCWIWFALIFVVEYSRQIFPCCYRKKDNVVNNVYNEEEENQLMEADVLEEEKMVKNSNEFSIKVENLRKVYPMANSNLNCCGKGTRNQTYKIAVKDLSFAVNKGECFCLLGTNGAGKTSVFKIQSGELLQTDGKAFIMGKDVKTELPSIRHLIGYCPQFDALLDNLTAKEHLEQYSSIKGIPVNKRENIIQNILKDLALKPFENVCSVDYSGGTKRKLSVAIALIGNPSIIFLDEPSSGMDPEARRFMWSVISTISSVKKEASVILTTHSMDEAEALSNKLGIMVEGKLKCIGAPQSLKNKYGDGYEIEIKLKIPNKQELLKMHGSDSIEDLALAVHRDKQEAIFGKQEGADKYYKEINEKGAGVDIWRMYENKKEVDMKYVQEFIAIQRHVARIREFQVKHFEEVSLLESFQSYIRFKVAGGVKLYQLFGNMESNKEELDIAQYSIKQISIEQIFISLANQADHDD